MVLTEEQKRAVLLKYIDPTKDFVRADNGKILVSIEASQRIAKEFNLKIGSTAQFEPLAISNYIIQREQQRLAAAASIARSKEAKEAAEKEKMEKVISCIQEMVEQGKNDFVIAQSLQAQCSSLALSEIVKGIEKATEMRILQKENAVKSSLIILTNRVALTNRFIQLYNTIPNKDKLVNSLANDMYILYTKKVLNLGHLRVALLDSGIEDDVIDEAVNEFYKLYEPEFLKQFQGLDLSLDELTSLIYEKYLSNDIFDANIILDYLRKLNKENIGVDELAYSLYKAEGDEQLVYQIMMIKDISVEERVKKLRDLELQYPISCLKRTFDILRPAYTLPYDEILEEYEKFDKNDTNEDDLIAVNEVVSTLSEDGDSFEETTSLITSPSEDVDEYQPIKLKIVKKEKEVDKIEKKKTLATLLIGAGFIPVAVLSLVFKVDPLVASKNCVTALGQLINGSMGIKEFLPSSVQLTTLFAGMGTTFVGFCNFLKNKAKLKHAKEELEELRELDDSESVKKGHR